jgi:L-serine dehydratase
MESIRDIYKIGHGPSSSHTMGPRFAAEQFSTDHPAGTYRVTLFGSLAATGKGHLTDQAIIEALAPASVEILWKPGEQLPHHPNGMRFESLDGSGRRTADWEVYSVGGGALSEGGAVEAAKTVYPHPTMDSITAECKRQGIDYWEFVQAYEDEGIWDYLAEVWEAMLASIDAGLAGSGVLPGDLGVPRKASALHRKSQLSGEHARRTGYLAAYSHAVTEQNAAGGVIVTAPTCGSCGVVPAVLRYLKETVKCSDQVFLQALATAGLIGNVVKANASISGAQVGCQGEVGTACAMAAGAAAQVLGGTIRQIEYAAEMGLEHFLGLTCDPVAGMVQIPCIERNTFGATRAMSVADYAMFTDGNHRVSFDEVVAVMKQTGHDLPSLYRETSEGGLATHVKREF